MHTRLHPRLRSLVLLFSIANSFVNVSLAYAEGRGGPPELPEAVKTCLEAAGVKLPERPTDGSRPQPPSEEDRAKVKKCFADNGLEMPRPPGGGGPRGGGRPPNESSSGSSNSGSRSGSAN